MPGTLFVVSTPIGNLEDITLRALRVLGEVSLVAAEDTRRTGNLLRHYAIRTPTTSFHEHNERRKVAELLDRLARGEHLALVSDAGTPGISDPGYRLVSAARQRGFSVQAVPGPSAVLAALVSSGAPTDAFAFEGFPPVRGKARDDWLNALANATKTTVFFEAPHRIRQTLQDLGNYLGDRPITVSRELTKLHEESVNGPIRFVLSGLEAPKGEFTVVVPAGPLTGKQDPDDAQAPGDEEIWREYGRMAERENSRRKAVTATAKSLRIAPRTVYGAIERLKAIRGR